MLRPMTPVDVEALQSAAKIVGEHFDAGRTLDQLGWSPPSGEPPDPPHGIMSHDEAIRTMASLGGYPAPSRHKLASPAPESQTEPSSR